MFRSTILGSRFHSVSRRSIRSLTVLFSLWLHASGNLHARQEPTLARGSQIEIVSERLPDGIAAGWLQTLTRDTLTFIDSTGTTAIALEDIGQLRVNVGRDKGSTNAATLAGAMLGGLVGNMTKPEDYECLSNLATEADCAEEVPSELVGAVIGAGALRLIARFALEERWENVRLDRLIYRTENEPRR